MTPKVHFILFVICLAAAIGCKKKNTPKPQSADQIKTHEFNPFIALTSVDTFYDSASNPPLLSPSDSITSYLLDIDGDAIPDFNFTVNHWYEWTSNMGYWANFNFQMTISGIENTSEIAVESATQFPYRTRFYSAGQSINSTAVWTNSSQLMRSGGAIDGPNYDLSGTEYIGLRIKNYSGYRYCWLKITKDPVKFNHKLQIESLGFNQSNGFDIAAGQEE